MDELGEFSPAQPVGAFDADSNIVNSEVEIRLSTGSSVVLDTRAPIADAADLESAASGIGVFCLATSYLNGTEARFPIDWSAGTDSWSVWMDNVESTAHGGHLYMTSSPENVYYYPSGNLHRYTFYSYYPRQESVGYDHSRITTTIALDGTQDIMWGASTPDMRDFQKYRVSYSAMYYREVADPIDPSISFNHQMAWLKFKIRSEANNDNDATRFGLVSLKLLDMPSTARLTIADLDDPTADGSIEYSGSTTYTLMDAGDTDLAFLNGSTGTGYWITGASLENQDFIGQGICIPAGLTEIDLKITLLRKSDGSRYSQTITKNIGELFAAPMSAGHTYTLNITVTRVGGLIVNGE